MTRTVKLLFAWSPGDRASADREQATQLPPVSRTALDQRTPMAGMLSPTASTASA